MKTVFMAQENIDQDGNPIFEVVTEQDSARVALCDSLDIAEGMAHFLNVSCKQYEQIGVVLNANPE